MGKTDRKKTVSAFLLWRCRKPAKPPSTNPVSSSIIPLCANSYSSYQPYNQSTLLSGHRQGPWKQQRHTVCCVPVPYYLFSNGMPFQLKRNVPNTTDFPFVHAEICQQILDWLPWNYVQMFIVVILKHWARDSDSSAWLIAARLSHKLWVCELDLALSYA